jgi:hypothetical protein
VARTGRGGGGGKYRLLGCSREKTERKRPFRISWRKWEDNIKIGLNETGKKGVDSTKLALDKED